MSVEVKELIIKASIKKNNNTENKNIDMDKYKSEIISECIDEVLRIIKRKENR